MNWPALGRPFFPTTFSDGEKFSSAAAGLICRSKRPRAEDVAVGIAALISTPPRWANWQVARSTLSVARQLTLNERCSVLCHFR